MEKLICPMVEFPNGQVFDSPAMFSVVVSGYEELGFSKPLEATTVQISLQPGFNKILAEYHQGHWMTELSVGPISEPGVYYLRARFVEEEGLPSGWSSPVVFKVRKAES